jgi:predicted transcriptional regulator
MMEDALIKGLAHLRGKGKIPMTISPLLKDDDVARRRAMVVSLLAKHGAMTTAEIGKAIGVPTTIAHGDVCTLRMVGDVQSSGKRSKVLHMLTEAKCGELGIRPTPKR